MINIVPVCMLCLLYSSGKQQIYEQIQKRVEDRNIQEEMKTYERQQIQEKQEKINQEDLKVKSHTSSEEYVTTCALHLTPPALLPGSGEKAGGKTTSAGGEHAHQCRDDTGKGTAEGGGEAG